MLHRNCILIYCYHSSLYSISFEAVIFIINGNGYTYQHILDSIFPGLLFYLDIVVLGIVQDCRLLSLTKKGANRHEALLGWQS